MLRKRLKGEIRTEEQLREHYEIEKELAARLRNAAREERRLLYASLYDELYRRVPHHQQLTQKASPQAATKAVSKQMGLLGRFLGKGKTFLEIGPGDCALSFEVAKRVKEVYAVDVSERITKSSAAPPNFELILSNGNSIPVPKDSIHVAYSYQLMEHLHPDDAPEQLKNIYDVLARNGIYVCITPNRLSGPWDISMYFDTVATGFHLKEYTWTEMRELFGRAGFRNMKAYVGGRGMFMRLPVQVLCGMEAALSVLPVRYRTILARFLPIRLLLGIKLVARK